MNQLRIQLQQVQSAKSIGDSMTRSLQVGCLPSPPPRDGSPPWFGVLTPDTVSLSLSQEELSDLKDQITLYESAVKLQVISPESNREWEDQLSDSYVELGIKKANWKSNRCHEYAGVWKLID